MKKSNKQARNNNLADFQDYVLEGLRVMYPIVKNRSGSYTLRSPHGSIDIFPKANKLFFRKTERWKNDGLAWLCNNL